MLILKQFHNFTATLFTFFLLDKSMRRRPHFITSVYEFMLGYVIDRFLSQIHLVLVASFKKHCSAQGVCSTP